MTTTAIARLSDVSPVTLSFPMDMGEEQALWDGFDPEVARQDLPSDPEWEAFVQSVWDNFNPAPCWIPKF